MGCTSKIAMVAAAIAAFAPLAANAQWVTGLQGAAGSTVGPDGALYVTQGAIGEVSRVDPQTGNVTTFASGLPPSLIGIGGAMDVAFLDGIAYALVSLVGTDVGGGSTVGIYRIDGPNSHTPIADLGSWTIANPSPTDWALPQGVPYAMETFRGGFLVTDGHHNRVIRVTLDGGIEEFRGFGNVVPTGLAVSGRTIYMAEAGPVPHEPADGRVVAFEPGSTGAATVATGARLAVDVEFGLGRSLYVLAQGTWDPSGFPGSPAFPFTGSLHEVNADGSLREIRAGLNLPTSMEIIGNTAYVVSLDGSITKIENLSPPPFGAAR